MRFGASQAPNSYSATLIFDKTIYLIMPLYIVNWTCRKFKLVTVLGDV